MVTSSRPLAPQLSTKPLRSQNRRGPDHSLNPFIDERLTRYGSILATLEAHEVRQCLCSRLLILIHYREPY